MEQSQFDMAAEAAASQGMHLWAVRGVAHSGTWGNQGSAAGQETVAVAAAAVVAVAVGSAEDLPGFDLVGQLECAYLGLHL